MLYVPHIAEARIARDELKRFLERAKAKAFESGLAPPESDAAKILIWATTLDFYLTEKPRAASSSASDLRAAKDVIAGDVWIMHLSDGGYSRLVISMFDEPHVWIDKSASLSKVLGRWATLGH